ncbi:MAG: type IX secretion system plug protein domain-containing protein [Bacteroidota bacterium]|nr:type IX secretion system plug protein domain-containing protein [Bacteroidota bacterium]
MKTFSTLFLLLAICSLFGQVATEVPAPPYIKSVQFYGNTAQSQLPVIRLGDPLNLSFDDIIGDEADYYYTITHHNYDWTPSVLAKTEYLKGVDDVRIMNYTNSVSTLQLYTHYELQIPNQYSTAILKSGNYLLSVFNSDDELIFSRKFMIYDPQVTVGVEVLRTRNLEFIEEKQVVNFNVDSGENILINPDETVKPLIIQNNDLKRSVGNIPPQYSIGNLLQYRYDDETSFYAGNEFFDYDNKDIRAATNSVQYIELLKLYHNYLYGNNTRKNTVYTYNPDLNGNFQINTIQGDQPKVNAEYAWIHFSLDHPQRPEGEEIHLYGNFNNFVIEDATKLQFNPENQRYELPILLKQGYYNYRYVVVKDGKMLKYNPVDGDFWQTENVYDVLVYYRAPGSRYDELIGRGNALSTSISNVRRD